MSEEDDIQKRLSNVEKDVEEWIKKTENDPSMIIVLNAVDSLDIALRIIPENRTKVELLLNLIADYVDPHKNSEITILDDLLYELKQSSESEASNITMLFQTFASSAQPGISRGPIRRIKLGSFENQ
jgi:hypothetical protein